jgi:hypothetical protein
MQGVQHPVGLRAQRHGAQCAGLPLD